MTPIAVNKTEIFVRTMVDVGVWLGIRKHLGYDAIQFCNDASLLMVL
jgi:hypothetical protein